MQLTIDIDPALLNLLLPWLGAYLGTRLPRRTKRASPR
jgi:hypothetical protein